jgi:hypothetical protein
MNLEEDVLTQLFCDILVNATAACQKHKALEREKTEQKEKGISIKNKPMDNQSPPSDFDRIGVAAFEQKLVRPELRRHAVARAAKYRYQNLLNVTARNMTLKECYSDDTRKHALARSLWAEPMSPIFASLTSTIAPFPIQALESSLPPRAPFKKSGVATVCVRKSVANDAPQPPLRSKASHESFCNKGRFKRIVRGQLLRPEYMLGCEECRYDARNSMTLT